MILQIFNSKNPEPCKDVLCMDHEYDEFVTSLELCRINHKFTSNSVVEGMQEIEISVEDTSTVNDYFY